MTLVLFLVGYFYVMGVVGYATRGCQRSLPFKALEGDGKCVRGKCEWCDTIREIEDEEIATMPFHRRRVERGPFR